MLDIKLVSNQDLRLRTYIFFIMFDQNNYKQKMNKTFAVGTDRNHEDLLPWWYYNIKKYSPKPDITIADLGMSPRMREWSQ